ncbi:MOSC N-terminal beta barrel domain-containing protein [Streptacidiphilus fuscans]|uniref:MOSC domain-containing protein n=1 Tax=Streptacidiphilus fuscans TaxID=2789292 RepID=A0A931B3Q0_9ACTN|nr:MOSC domain-containing protein [Streptacidiphilus fuscans]MBF9070645.1 MOSC domain-containing protein [Streptacidiphilus fuscans]
MPLRVTELRRHPVTSLGGESVNRLRLSGGRVAGDRALAIVTADTADTADTGRVLTARHVPQLREASARWLTCLAEITLPGGEKVRSDDPAASAVLSDWLGRAVRLAHPTGGPLAVEFGEAPVHLVSEGSLRAARRWHREGDRSTSWLRPNIVVAAGDDRQAENVQAENMQVENGKAGIGQVENVLIGHQVALGEALIDITGPSRPSSGNATAFGVHARITRAGWVSVGDSLNVLPVNRPVLIADGV